LFSRFAVVIYVSCGLSVESCGVLRYLAVFRHTGWVCLKVIRGDECRSQDLFITLGGL